MIAKYKLDPDTFSNILLGLPAYVENISQSELAIIMYAGNLDEHANRKHIFYSEADECFICTQKVLNYFAQRKFDRKSYLLCACYLDKAVTDNTEIEQDEWTGNRATNYMNKLLSRHYTPEQINERLDMFKEEHYKPIHMTLPKMFKDNVVHKFKDCVYYDINSAYGDALREIFPEAARDIEKLYNDRKEHPENKKILNYYVGNLANKRKGGLHRATFNWIVKRTRDKLDELVNRVGGYILYANTDGVIIWKPEHILPGSNVIGEFKSELTTDTVYAFSYKDKSGTPYIIYQYEDNKGIQIKGNLSKKVRDTVDLSIGKAVVYSRTREYINGMEHFVTIDKFIKNINTEVINHE